MRGVAASADNTGNFLRSKLIPCCWWVIAYQRCYGTIRLFCRVNRYGIVRIANGCLCYIVNFIRFIIFDKTIQASVARDEADMKAGKLVPNEFNILVTPEELKKEAE